MGKICLMGNKGLLRAASALAICSTAGACALDSQGDALTETAQPLYVASEKLWRSPTIPVCWEGGGTPEERDWVVSAVQNSWEAVSSVRFVGWAPCAPGSGGLRVRLEDTVGHTMGLGRDLDGVIDGMTL